jgi:hypothetical protein
LADLIWLLESYDPRPSERFYARMARAPWLTRSPWHSTVPRRAAALAALFILGAVSATLVVSPEVRASALAMLGWRPLGFSQSVPIAGSASQSTDASAFAGAYSSEGPAASSPGRVLSITLGPDGRVIWSTDFRNGRPPIVELGTWQLTGPGRVEVTISGSDQRAYDAPRRIVFERRGEALVAVEYDQRVFGSNGVQVWRSP